jgi:hypothetical protein
MSSRNVASRFPVAAFTVLLVTALLSLVVRAADDPRGGIFDFGKDPTGGPAKPAPATPTTKPAAATRPATPASGLAPVVASAIQIVADDFVADIYHNGKLVPAESRTLQAEIFGAQVERVALTLKPGDWVVFNVVNNRLRWDGAYYFAAAAVDVDGLVVFASQTTGGEWSACDDVAQVARFISERDYLRDHKAQRVKKEWDRGDREIHRVCPDFTGEGVWGSPAARSTWIKFVVPNR